MTDPIDNLRSANPVSNDPAAADRATSHSANAEALFQEITMTDPTASDAPRTTSPFSAPPSREAITRSTTTRRPPRKLVAGTAAAAAAAVLGFGAVALIPGSTSPAAASMITAAQQTQAADSGTVTVTLDWDERGDLGSTSLVTDYSGDDLATRLVESTEFDFDGQMPQIRIVDDVIYVNEGDNWLAVRDPRIITLINTLGLPTDIRETMSAGVVELIERADDAVETADGNFTATVTALEVKEVAEAFPGFGIIAGEAMTDDVADEVLQLDVVLDDDGLIDTVTLSAADLADDPGPWTESVDVSITVDFDDLDAGATIEAPENAEELDLEGFGGGGLFGD